MKEVLPVSTVERFKTRIIQDYQRGRSLRAIGRKYGVSHETVSKNLIAWGEPIRKRGSWRKLSPEQIKTMCQKYNGETLEELARQYNVCPSTISRIFKSNKVEPVKRRKYDINYKAFDTLNIHSVYWLGYLYSRGFLKSKYHFEVNAPSDRFHTMRINRFREFLNTKQPWITTDTRIRFTITCKELVSKLSELGVRPIVHIKYPNILNNSLLHTSFIRGYFDGRGTATRIVGGYDLDVVANPKFLDDINKMLSDMTGTKGTKVDPKRLRYSQEEAKIVAQLLAMKKSKTARTLPYSDSLARILKYHKRKRNSESARSRQN